MYRVIQLDKENPPLPLTIKKDYNRATAAPSGRTSAFLRRDAPTPSSSGTSNLSAARTPLY